MAEVSAWLPKSVTSLRGYDRATFAADLLSGVTVGLVALPLAMAFSIASGLPPQSGIYCAIVTGFLISLLGGSRCQIGGPTGAFVVVIAGIVARHGVDGLFMCTMMAGVLRSVPLRRHRQDRGDHPRRGLASADRRVAFQDLAETLHAHGRSLLFCGARDQPRKLMAQARFAEVVGRENICDNVLDALARAEALVGASQPA